MNYSEKFAQMKNTFSPQQNQYSQKEESQFQSYYSKQGQRESAEYQNANFKKNNYLGTGNQRPHEVTGNHSKDRPFSLDDDEDICTSFNHDASNRKPMNTLAHNYRYKEPESYSIQQEQLKRPYESYQTSMNQAKPIPAKDKKEAQPQHSNQRGNHDQEHHDPKVKNTKQLREDVYQGIMDSIVQLKAHHSTLPIGQSSNNYAQQNKFSSYAESKKMDGMNLDQILLRFHSLLLSPNTPLGPEDLYSVSYLFSFYQRHISELQSKVLELESAGSELARRCKVQGVDKSGLSEASAARDTKQELALARLKTLADNAEQTAQQAKRNEGLAIERLSRLTLEYEAKDKELFSVKNELDGVIFKIKEAEMEIQRLNMQNKSLSNRYEEVLKEKREALDLAEEAHHRSRKNEGKSDEIESLRGANERLKTSAEGLIDEVCRYKFRIKELELENNALKDIREIALKNLQQPKENKYDDFERIFSEKIMKDHAAAMNHADSYSQSSSKSKANPYVNYHDQQRPPSSPVSQLENPYKSPADFGSPKQMNSGTKDKQLPPRIPGPNTSSQMAKIFDPQGKKDKEAPLPLPTPSTGHSRPESGTGSRDARRSSSASIMNMPAQQRLVDNAGLIGQLEQELSDHQHRKMALDGKLCRMKDRPKTLNERQEKEACEEEIEIVTKKMSEIRKRLREFNKC